MNGIFGAFGFGPGVDGETSGETSGFAASAGGAAEPVAIGLKCGDCGFCRGCTALFCGH